MGLSLVNHWPNSYLKDIAWILLNENDLSEVIGILDETDYNQVWIREEKVHSVKIVDGENISYIENPNLKKLERFLPGTGIMNLRLGKGRNGIWTLGPGHIDSWEYTKQASGDDIWHVQVDNMYAYKNLPDLKSCQKQDFESTEGGWCLGRVVGNWANVKFWFAQNTTEIHRQVIEKKSNNQFKRDAASGAP